MQGLHGLSALPCPYSLTQVRLLLHFLIHFVDNLSSPCLLAVLETSQSCLNLTLLSAVWLTLVTDFC